MIKDRRENYQALLAYLWTISRSIAPSIRLTDPPDDPALGGRIQESSSKLFPLTPTTLYSWDPYQLPRYDLLRPRSDQNFKIDRDR
jgi:hypothetical protein